MNDAAVGAFGVASRIMPPPKVATDIALIVYALPTGLRFGQLKPGPAVPP